MVINRILFLTAGILFINPVINAQDLRADVLNPNGAM